MILLVCGGRGFRSSVVAFAVLDRIHERRGITRVVQGEAPGADTLAKWWAKARGVDCSDQYRARWEDVDRPGARVRLGHQGKPYDAAAGLVRNQRMLDEEQVDGVLAFPGGTGTRDMCERAERAGIPVMRVDHEGRQIRAA